ncbi:Tol biopolymer transport system component/cytosine/adenosine deaminase-related metal-dependent hydrolase [Kribbella aluminosa]|uniref:Tol biopolymer transport system component/cytosine/adenosine deaminase-related metal-dependent hydrolase n=1 Tax=Kribbella aluminosa TaxID=416017 RepID=A0ABS4UZK5_9ACTN|nr:amidohydrolase family protein [Kribbella aluminosa]MBP2357047.1 Tol biopolymer transport system component/cytosine/adenosine deaminase-related metal-dependent hydrolase [Kribbella aluminosa]
MSDVTEDPGPWSISRRRALQLSGGVAAVGAVQLPAQAGPPPAGNQAVLREGTNFMVAVSPDGKWLAFDLATAIWVTPAAGGTSRRLTDDLQDATRPRWSPDGKWIVFQSYRDGNFHLWTIRPDGSGLRQLTTGRYDHREPQVTPDGRSIVFSSDRGGNGSYGIHRLVLASGTSVALTDEPSEEAEPVVSPDGTKVAFTVDTGSIVELDLTTRARTTLVAAQTGISLFGPSYSPVGKLAYVRLTGPACNLIVDNLQVTTGKDVFALPPSWASATDVFYTADGTVHRYHVGGEHTVVPFAATVPVTSKRPRPKAPDLESTAKRTVRGIASPTVSPDGKWLAFRALNALWLAAADGKGRPRTLVADGYFNSDPDFSPDGKKLLYASDRDGTADLWLHDLATGTDTKLSGLPGAQTAPRFSPDGRQIAYQDQDGIARVLDIASGQLRQLTPTLFQPGRVSWSRDGRTLVLAAVKPFSKRFREGTSQLLYVDVATAALEYVEPMPFRSLATRGDDGPVFSPDGAHLAFVVESLLYVVPVDTRGRFTGEPRAITSEVTDSPAWQDDQTLLYLSNGKLRRTTITGGPAETVRLDLQYRRATINQHVTIHAGALWDGRATTLRHDVDVVLDGSRIAAVRPHQGRADVDASKLTVMPGLIDAHNHWHLRGRAWGARQGNLWLAYGITTTRSPGDPVYQMQETREALANGTLRGPRYFATGEAIDGSRVFYNFMRPTLSVRQLGLELDRVEGLAYDLVKTYVRLPIEYQRRAIAAVHRLGLQLSSHYLYPAEHLGMDGMEHTGATNRLGYSHTVSRLGRAYADVVALFTRAGLSVTPTLFNSTMAHVDDPSLLTDRRTTTLYPSWEYDALIAKVNTAKGPAGITTRELLRGNVDMVLRIHRGGGLVISGTDTPLDNMAVSLHANLRSMVAGGFTPYEALTTATHNPARWLNLEDKLGVVRPGAQADLSFVAGDPLADIRAAAAVEQVMIAGNLHTVDELLAPYTTSNRVEPAVRTASAPQPLTREQAHAHDDAYWWHEPEWLHRACCEG